MNKNTYEEHKNKTHRLKKILVDYTDNNNIIIFRYLLVGGFTTIINIVLLYLFVEFLRFDYKISNIISMLICIVITYYLSKKIVFSKKVKIRCNQRIYKLYYNCNSINNY